MILLRERGASWRQFSRYVLPSVGAMLLFSMYTVVDGMFIAWGVGETALTSVNIALPFVNALSGFAVLISMGTATLVAFARGRGDKEEADGLFSQTVLVIVLVSAVVTGLAAFFARELAAFLGAGEHTIDKAAGYLRIVSLFSVCFILSYCLEIMVKVDDNPKMAVIGAATSFMINVGLDYVFIMKLGWGIAGAAFATGLAQLASLVLFLAYFFSKRSNLKIRAFKPRLHAFRKIFPLGISDCSIEIIIAFLTFMYNRLLFYVFGEGSLTIYAVIAYINLIVLMIMQGIAQGMMHLVSLHIGKREPKAAQGYFSMCILAGLALSIAVTLLCQIRPQFVAGFLLSQDSPVFGETIRALKQFSLSFPLVGINIAIAGYFTAWGMPLPSIVLALSRGFLFAPLALLPCALLFGGRWIWIAAFLGELLCFAFAMLLFKRKKRDMVIIDGAI